MLKETKIKLKKIISDYTALNLSVTYLHGLAQLVAMGPNPRHAISCFSGARRGDAEEIDAVLSKFDVQPECVFVQIGSNDGRQDDPLHRHVLGSDRWRGVLVEPVPHLFEKLKQTYAGRSNLTFVNGIVSNRAAPKRLYYVGPRAKEHLPDLPYWYDQLGSFSRTHIVRHLGAEVEPFIEEHLLPAVTLMQLLAEYGISDLDVLHTDTEGHDYDIIKSINFSISSPKCILFEYKHMSYTQCARLLLRLRGRYAFVYTDSDLLAVEHAFVD